MTWIIKFSKEANYELSKLDKSVQKKISAFIDKLNSYPSPRSVGKALKGQYSGLWRYKVADYRLICSIHDNVLTVEVVKIGHRSKVYQDK